MFTFLLLKGDECLSSLQKYTGSLADGKHSSDCLSVIITLLFDLSTQPHLCVWNLGIDLDRWNNTTYQVIIALQYVKVLLD